MRDQTWQIWNRYRQTDGQTKGPSWSSSIDYYVHFVIWQEICEKLNLQVRGVHGEHSESEGGVYDISNKQRLGLTEYEAVKQMYDGVNTLIDMEKGKA